MNLLLLMGSLPPPMCEPEVILWPGIILGFAIGFVFCVVVHLKYGPK